MTDAEFAGVGRRFAGYLREFRPHAGLPPTAGHFVDNGIVTVHLGACRGDLKALLDADLFLPKSWDADRPRCRAAGIPAAKGPEAKWKLAFGQWTPAVEDGFAFDWLTFDEAYGRGGAFLGLLDFGGQR